MKRLFAFSLALAGLLPSLAVAQVVVQPNLFQNPLNLVEHAGMRTLVSPFTEAKQLGDRLDQLAEAWRVKARERRYTQAFRERHYDFLRRYVELKTKIERAINEGPG